MRIATLLMLLGFFLLISCTDHQLEFTNQGHSNFTIVIPDRADSLELFAAQELAGYISKVSGVSLPVLPANKVSGQYVIKIGREFLPEDMTVHGETIVIKTDPHQLFIAGGNAQSTVYAVYTFIENQLGCRFYTPDTEKIPNQPNIHLSNQLSYTYTPPITTRTVHSLLYYDHPTFANKRKTTPQAFPGFVPSARVHTFNKFLPPDVYYNSHPEYYALRNGRRIATQLCLTNKTVLKIVQDSVNAILAKSPHAKVISVSQNDNQQYCECSACTAINEREGTPAGSIITFVNEIARAHPDKMISTLAYQYSRKAPKHLKPEYNVLITLCSIECDRSAPIAEKCTDFAADLIAWGKLTKNIRIWDYTTQFTNFLAPFPNLQTLQPNVQLFRDNHAKWVFEQHSNQPSELFELRSYLTAKLLWNPDINFNTVLDDFLSGYYEEAAPFIKKYISTIHNELAKDSTFFLFLYGDPAQAFESFLRPSLLQQYDQLYDEAESAVMEKQDILARVRLARLSIDYAILEASRRNDPNGFSTINSTDDGTKKVNKNLRDRLTRFRNTCKKANITMMNEMRLSVAEYLTLYEHNLARAIKKNIAVGKDIKLLEKPKKYANEDPNTLVDGALGGTSFFANWLGFEGNDLDAVVDLGKATTLHKLSIDFLQVANHVVFFPKQVKFYSSEDGTSYSLLGVVKNANPLTPASKINDIQTFQVTGRAVQGRYIRIVAENLGTAPGWHFAAGLPAWIFADEIIVE